MFRTQLHVASILDLILPIRPIGNSIRTKGMRDEQEQFRHEAQNHRRIEACGSRSSLASPMAFALPATGAFSIATRKWMAANRAR
jgi:hypothetical protein